MGKDRVTTLMVAMAMELGVWRQCRLQPDCKVSFSFRHAPPSAFPRPTQHNTPQLAQLFIKPGNFRRCYVLIQLPRRHVRWGEKTD